MRLAVRPHILVVDDDRDFLSLIQKRLAKLGFKVTLSATADDFLTKFQSEKPDACLVDLKLGNAMVGFQLLESVRVRFKSEVPLFVASSESDAKIIAHAMEMGATDYIVKPIDEASLAAKLSPYFTADGLAQARPAMTSVAADRGAAQLGLDFQLRAIDENGLTLASPHLITKGSLIDVAAPLLAQVIARPEGAVRVTVMDTWADADQKTYLAYARFDESDEPLLTAVRRWLVSRSV